MLHGRDARNRDRYGKIGGMRWVVRFLVSVCAFLFLVTVGLWVWSYRAPWRVSWEGEGVLCEVRSMNGGFMVERVTGWPGWDMLGISRSMEPDLASIRDRWGVRWLEGRPMVMQIYSPRYDTYVMSGGGSFVVGNKAGVPKDYRARMVVVPYAWPAGVLGLPVLLAGVAGARRGWRGWVRRRRRARGLCEACGYDVRASAGRCPECGTGC
jgi:hypothetical protein